MVCFHPYTVWQKPDRSIECELDEALLKKENKVHFKHTSSEHVHKFEIPCGHCLGCRLDHAAMWASRLAIEAEEWQKNCFVTLTYNNHGKRKDGTPNLPLAPNGQPTVSKRDIQLFFKRLRKLEKGNEAEYTTTINDNLQPITKTTYPIKYFACGEYGDKNHRPHAHALIFNYQPKDLKPKRQVTTGGLTYMLYTSETLSKIWGHGFVIIGIVNYETACYTARYVQKKAGIAPQKRFYLQDMQNKKTRYYTEEELNSPKPEFILMSQGLGLKYWQKNKDKIKRNSGFTIQTSKGTKFCPIPRYFKKKWEKEDWQEFHLWKFNKTQQTNKNMLLKLEKLKFNNNILNTDEMKKTQYLQIQERALQAKSKYFKRNNMKLLI